MDRLRPDQRSALMARVRQKRTKPEMAVRSLLHRKGYRFLVNTKALPGSPDVVFTRRKKAIFVHGCFWHQHPDCRLATLPSSRTTFWLAKFERNRHRDEAATRSLVARGWEVLIVWECQTRQEDELEKTLIEFLGPTKVGKCSDRT
ncbi:MAG TPA: very short patch repair endonuclease [Magnetospirillum sp.]|nr:very short patch repair endonuclease [Magnetospirillum sp.]